MAQASHGPAASASVESGSAIRVLSPDSARPRGATRRVRTPGDRVPRPLSPTIGRVTATSRWALYAAVPLLAVAIVSLVFVLRSNGSTHDTSVPTSTDAAATWA